MFCAKKLKLPHLVVCLAGLVIAQAIGMTGHHGHHSLLLMLHDATVPASTSIVLEMLEPAHGLKTTQDSSGMSTQNSCDSMRFVSIDPIDVRIV